MREYTIIIGSITFFDSEIQKLNAKGEEFSDVISAHDAAKNIGRQTPRVNSLIVRNNHYHGIVESAHARLGGLIEDLTTETATIFIHNPTSILLRYIQRQNEAKNCFFQIIKEPRQSLNNIHDVQNKIEHIREQIIGQDNALKEIGKTLLYLANTKREKPYVLMFYGKSSLGKTETAKAIADVFFNGKMVERHLSMFEDFSLANSDYLFGGKPSVNSIGYELNERESNLVFLDEMDKCGAMYHSAFYSLFDSPLYIDTTYEVDISSLLIVLTCNYLSEDEIRKKLGDPIYFRIDKCILFEDFLPESLKDILENEVDNQLSLISNDVHLDRDEVTRFAAKRIPVIGSNGRTVQAAVRSTIENLLYMKLE